MLRTASSLPHTRLLTLGSDPARFQTGPPACYRASWQLRSCGSGTVHRPDRNPVGHKHRPRHRIPRHHHTLHAH